MTFARSGAKTATDRAAREVRGCGVLYAIRYHNEKKNAADPAAVKIEGADNTSPPPEGFVWLHGTARVCMRPFGHDGSDHRGWSRERVTDKPRHSGPRVWIKQPVRADRWADYFPGRRVYGPDIRPAVTQPVEAPANTAETRVDP